MTAHRRVLSALLLGLAVVGCAAEKSPARADSSPDQAGAPVPPPAGVTAAALPAPVMPETIAAGAGGRSTSSRRNSTSRIGATTATGRDTLEYDRAIEYKPDPRKELPAVRP